MKKFLITPEVPPEANFSYIQQGTTLLVGITSNQLILMADSRTEKVFADMQTREIIDTTNKIKQAGSAFFAIAGTSHFRNTDVDSLIQEKYDNSKSVVDNAKYFYILISEILNNYYNNLSQQENEYHITTLEDDKKMFQLLMVGFNKNEKVIVLLQFDIIRNNNNGYTIKDSGSTFQTLNETNTGLVSAGSHKEIDKVVNSGFYIHNLTIENLIYLISLEADESEKVGHGVNYVILNKEGLFRGQSY